MNPRQSGDGNTHGPTFNEQIDTLRALPPAQQQVAINDLLADQQHTRTCTQIAAQLCMTFRLDRNAWLDEFTQLARFEAWKIITDAVGNPELKIVTFRGLIMYRTKSRAVDEINRMDSPAVGMATLKRRLKRFADAQNELRLTLGREPTDDEAIEAANELTRQTTKRVGGMILSKQDLSANTKPVSIDEATDALSNAGYTEAPTPQSKAVITGTTTPSHENETTIVLDVIEAAHRTIALAKTQSPQLAEVAELWLAPIISRTGDLPTEPPVIAKSLNLSRSTVDKLLHKARSIMYREYENE